MIEILSKNIPELRVCGDGPSLKLSVEVPVQGPRGWDLSAGMHQSRPGKSKFETSETLERYDILAAKGMIK